MSPPGEYENFKTTPRRLALPNISATITTESQRVGILPPVAQPFTSRQTSPATGNSYSVYYKPIPIGF